MSNIRNRPPRVKGPFCRVGQRPKPGRASRYIQHARQIVRPGDKVVACIRVSERFQKYNGNLADQKANMLRELAKLKAVVVGVIEHVGSGNDPSWLLAASKYGDDVKLVAETVDRFIRPVGYRPSNNLTARKSDFLKVKHFTKRKQLLTIAHPDASLSDSRSYHSKRGQQQKANKGGRPGRKRNIRMKLVPRARKMRGYGYSLGEIAKKLNISKATVQYWENHYF